MPRLPPIILALVTQTEQSTQYYPSLYYLFYWSTFVMLSHIYTLRERGPCLTKQSQPWKCGLVSNLPCLPAEDRGFAAPRGQFCGRVLIGRQLQLLAWRRIQTSQSINHGSGRLNNDGEFHPSKQLIDSISRFTPPFGYCRGYAHASSAAFFRKHLPIYCLIIHSLYFAPNCDNHHHHPYRASCAHNQGCHGRGWRRVHDVGRRHFDVHGSTSRDGRYSSVSLRDTGDPSPPPRIGASRSP